MFNSEAYQRFVNELPDWVRSMPKDVFDQMIDSADESMKCLVFTGCLGNELWIDVSALCELRAMK